MNEEQSNYQAYLIRIWLVDDDDQTAWRATLENAKTGERLGFSTLQGLFDYLDVKTELMSYRFKIKQVEKKH